MLAAETALPFNKTNLVQSTKLLTKDLPAVQADPSTGDKLLPVKLPAAIGEKLTIRNALIGAAIAVAGYAAYAFLFAPPKKKAPSAPTAPVSGFFSFGNRRRRRRF